MMHAKPGDWLVAESRTDSRHARQAEVLEVHGTDGTPPYLVRWLDDAREALVFPGPDAQIMTTEQLVARDRYRADRIGRVQAEILAAEISESSPTGSR
jgi:hypothetical protein